MTRFLSMALLILAPAIAGCAASQAATPTPVQPATITPQQASNVVIASALVVPTRTSDLSFIISAPVKEISINEGDTVQAGQSLVTLHSPELEYGLAQAEDALRAAEFRHEYWIPARFDRPPERRQLAEAELVIAQKQFETAQANLTLTTLVAPFDGTVISIKVRQGEFVQAGQTVILLADLTTLRIETTDLSERDIHSVKVGQPAVVAIEALEEEFNGQVTSISPLAAVIGGDIVYKVIISLDEQPVDLLWGMNAEVEINTEQ